MKSQFDKFEAADAARERWLGEIEKVARPLYWEWLKIRQMSDSSFGQGNRFPDTIRRMESGEEWVEFHGKSTYRGCTDYEYCHLPVALLFASDEERKQMLRDLEADQHVILKARADALVAQQEQTERAQLARLQQKYGD